MTTSQIEALRVQDNFARAHKVLDKIYLWSGYSAATCLCLILVIIVAQIGIRYSGNNLSGLQTYAGYMMAASTFLGLPYALINGSHIRIETIAKLLPPGPRRALDLIAFCAGTIVALWLAYYACNMVFTSWQINDVSTDLDATPLWIPQSTMAIGSLLFAIAMIDNFLTLLITGKYRIHSNFQASH